MAQARPLLSSEACRAVRTEVHALRQHWAHKSALSPFYTLGVSAYLEAQDGGAIAYTLAAKRQRPILWAAFSVTYEALLEALRAELGGPVEYSTRLALPGFNIFIGDVVFEKPVCRIHIDQPYSNVHWRAWEEVDLERTLSFTVAIALPRGGAGLNTWPTLSPEWGPGGRALAEIVAGTAPSYVPYSLGGLVIHDGHTIHQIAPFTAVEEGDERITMQGHAIASSHGWLVYF